MMDEMLTKSGFFGRGRMESAGRDGTDWVEKGRYLEFVKLHFFESGCRGAAATYIGGVCGYFSKI